jgi:hypothetical protein
VLVPAVQDRSPDVYEARAQVGLTAELALPNLDGLPRLATSVFSNGSVGDEVRHALRLQPGTSVIPSRVRLVAPQDNPILEVVGRASNREQAKALADLAASTFVIELNQFSESVGQFKLTHAAEADPKPKSKLAGGYLAVVMGLIAGLIAGVGAVALLLVLRRPVVDSAAAEDATGVQVLGRIKLPRSGTDLEASDLMGIGLLCRRILTVAPSAVYLAGPQHVHVQQLNRAMNVFMQRIRQVRRTSGPPNYAAKMRDKPHGGRTNGDKPTATPGKEAGPSSVDRTPTVTTLDGPSLEQWAQVPDDSSMTLLIVPEGIPTRRLRELADEHFTGTPAGVALVATHPRFHRRKESVPMEQAAYPVRRSGKKTTSARASTH